MKTVGKIVAVLLVLLLLIGGFAGSVWVAFSRSAAFADADQGKADIFAEKKVMVIVPHEDDELNLFGGLFEEYLKYGSNVKVVFVTNGDLYLPRETRIREAINALSEVGVTEDNIVFLGYGDGYLYKHLYNAYDGERLISEAGFMETHGADFHPAFIEEHPFTRENYIEDIKACMLLRKLWAVFCERTSDINRWSIKDMPTARLSMPRKIFIPIRIFFLPKILMQGTERRMESISGVKGYDCRSAQDLFHDLCTSAPFIVRQNSMSHRMQKPMRVL